MHWTPMTGNNYTNNNVAFFFVSDLKIVYYKSFKSSITMSWENILRQDLFGDKIIQNSLQLYGTHEYNNDSLLRQKT